VPIINVSDFHCTTVADNFASTYARAQVELGVAQGTQKVAFFALARTDNTWKVCTAEIR
jgi:hypothetical protein